jgi:hypothetical protein
MKVTAMMVVRLSIFGTMVGVAGILAGLLGCGGSAVELPTQPASGTVTYQGNPVAGATVTFSPEGEGRAAFGRTDESGHFTLTTLQPGDGALEGSYTVAITKRTEPAGGAASGDGWDPNDAEDVDAAYRAYEAEKKQNAEPNEAENLLPPKYADPATSPLTAQVTADGENTWNFELTE